MSDRIPAEYYPIPEKLEQVLNNDDLKNSSKDSATTGEYIELLKYLKTVKYLDIVENHYLKLLRLALHLEEYQCNKDMKKHEMFNETIEHVKNIHLDTELGTEPDPDSNLFRITIDGLDEERPWIKPNDYVDLFDTCHANKEYTLRVRSVTKTDIIANDENKKLRHIHTDSTLYNIKFRFQNYPLRCAHYALLSMYKERTVTYLFPHPRKSYFNDETRDYSDFEFVNPSIEGNVEQKQAISNIVNKSSFPLPYILYGPPGTGKTATLVEAICQIHNGDDYSHVLVCTPSNTAGDEITRRLLQFLPRRSIYRMYSQSTNGSKIDKEFELCCNVDSKKKIVLPTHAEVDGARIVITTLCNAIRLIIMGVDYSHFSHVFIDEAGQGTEPDILIPVSLVSAGGNLYSQIVFAGDPQQLGPTVISKYAESILGRSILERLMRYNVYRKDRNNKYNPKYITKLLNNYRSHPAIIHVSNVLFYENELIAKCPRSSGKNDKFPIIFHGVKGKEEKYANSSSVGNPKEVDIVIEYVENLLNDKMGFGAVTADEIGVVTPFALQSKMIKKALKDRKLYGINVGTVELFQGQERKVMIFTAVRSKIFDYQGKKHIGFLSNYKRFNVAITRAKKLLIIVGNPMVLQMDRNWRYLLKFCLDNRVYKGMPFRWLNYGQHPNFAPPHHVKSTAMLKQQPMPFRPCVKKLIGLVNNLKIDL